MGEGRKRRGRSLGRRGNTHAPLLGSAANEWLSAPTCGRGGAAGGCLPHPLGSHLTAPNARSLPPRSTHRVHPRAAGGPAARCLDEEEELHRRGAPARRGDSGGAGARRRRRRRRRRRGARRRRRCLNRRRALAVHWLGCGVCATGGPRVLDAELEGAAAAHEPHDEEGEAWGRRAVLHPAVCVGRRAGEGGAAAPKVRAIAQRTRSRLVRGSLQPPGAICRRSSSRYSDASRSSASAVCGAAQTVLLSLSARQKSACDSCSACSAPSCTT